MREFNELKVSDARQGSQSARASVKKYAETLMADGKDWPTWLRDYALSTMADCDGRKQGRQPDNHKARNLLVVAFVDMACDQLGVLPTRNRATAEKRTRESGCSIVAEAFGMTELNVNKIWADRPHTVNQEG